MTVGRAQPSPASFARRAAKAGLSYLPGKLPAYHLARALARAGETRSLARFEQEQSLLATRAWGRQPVASVITVIPTFQREELVVAAVESALGQSVQDHVVIVIEDGGSGRGLRYLPADERLFTFSLTRHCGVAGVVRNVAIAASGSKYLAFLDDDNEWTPDHLDVSLAVHRLGAQFTYTAVQRVRPDGVTHDVVSRPYDRGLLREQSLADTSAIVVRRADWVRFSRVPLRREEFPSEDWELTWRCARNGRVEHIPVVTVRYRLHDGSYFRDWRKIVANVASPERRRALVVPKANP